MVIGERGRGVTSGGDITCIEHVYRSDLTICRELLEGIMSEGITRKDNWKDTHLQEGITERSDGRIM